MNKRIWFIDLFAGIGGFHTAMRHVGGRFAFTCEWDKHARTSYEANYKNIELTLFKKNTHGNYMYSNRHSQSKTELWCLLWRFSMSAFLYCRLLMDPESIVSQNLKKVLSLQRFLTASDLLTSDVIWIGLQKRKEQNKQNGRGRYSLIQGRQRIHKHHFCYIFEKCKRDSYRPIRERIKSYKTNPCRDWKITRL